MISKVLELAAVSARYDDNLPVFEEVDLTVFENDFLGIIGPNGGGKTTLLKLILGLLKPVAGEISFYRHSAAVSSINVGYLPQINQIDKKFPISVREVIASGLSSKSGLDRAEKRERVLEIAFAMGVEGFLDKPIGELSGGQFQRALLGRAIVDRPELLILDEPNSYVDKRFEVNFNEVLADLNKTTAIIMVSHDVGTVLSIVKNIACVNAGLHYHSGTDISAEWFEKSYDSCPIEILGHGDLPHRILGKHEGYKCCED